MITLFILFVAESLVFALIWHNGSTRSEREREGQPPDRAVLYSGPGADTRKPCVPAAGHEEPERQPARSEPD